MPVVTAKKVVVLLNIGSPCTDWSCVHSTVEDKIKTRHLLSFFLTIPLLPLLPRTEPPCLNELFWTHTVADTVGNSFQWRFLGSTLQHRTKKKGSRRDSNFHRCREEIWCVYTNTYPHCMSGEETFTSCWLTRFELSTLFYPLFFFKVDVILILFDRQRNDVMSLTSSTSLQLLFI